MQSTGLEDSLTGEILEHFDVLERWIGMNEEKYENTQEILDEVQDRLLASRRNPRVS